MALFFITGMPSSGKTSVWQELKARGYEAYDIDEDDIARWHNIETGYVYPRWAILQTERTSQFIKTHSWNVAREDIEKLAQQSYGKLVFVCGLAGNMPDFHDLFEAVFALELDEATLKRRLATRTNNDWGKRPHELAQTLERQRAANSAHQAAGYTLIDATQPLHAVVEHILQGIAASNTV